MEPRKAGEEFEGAINQYYDNVKMGRGGLFVAVCRGKVRTSWTPVAHAHPPVCSGCHDPAVWYIAASVVDNPVQMMRH